MLRHDVAFARLSLLCALAGLPPLAWREMSALDFEAALRRRWS